MTSLNKTIRFMFFLSLGLSIGFPLGVLGIIFGAINKIIPLLVIGIIFAVLGFYVMPIMWVKYADFRHDRTLFSIIETERIYTVSALAQQTGYTEKDVRFRILRLIHARVLVGYIFENDTLIPNDREEAVPEKEIKSTKICERCGAPMPYDGEKYKCEYCGYICT